MKRSNITHSVMDKVVRFEEQRTKRWLAVFVITVVVLTGCAALFLFYTYAVVSERHTLDVLAIFYEDREIISEFWQDTLSVAIEELPQKPLVLGSSALVLLTYTWIMTRRRRRIVARRMAQLAKRKKSSDNK
ncbi:MAG: hypothetical protein AAB960_01825 [Patescibacteria group bacterium]